MSDLRGTLAREADEFARLSRLDSEFGNTPYVQGFCEAMGQAAIRIRAILKEDSE